MKRNFVRNLFEKNIFVLDSNLIEKLLKISGYICSLDASKEHLDKLIESKIVRKEGDRYYSMDTPADKLFEFSELSFLTIYARTLLTLKMIILMLVCVGISGFIGINLFTIMRNIVLVNLISNTRYIGLEGLYLRD